MCTTRRESEKSVKKLRRHKIDLWTITFAFQTFTWCQRAGIDRILAEKMKAEIDKLVEEEEQIARAMLTETKLQSVADRYSFSI